MTQTGCRHCLICGGSARPAAQPRHTECGPWSLLYCRAQAYGVLGCFRFLEGHYLLLITKRRFQGRICSAPSDFALTTFPLRLVDQLSATVNSGGLAHEHACPQITKCTVLQIQLWCPSLTRLSKSSRCGSFLPKVVAEPHVFWSIRHAYETTAAHVLTSCAVGRGAAVSETAADRSGSNEGSLLPNLLAVRFQSASTALLCQNMQVFDPVTHESHTQMRRSACFHAGWLLLLVHVQPGSDAADQHGEWRKEGCALRQHVRLE